MAANRELSWADMGISIDNTVSRPERGFDRDLDEDIMRKCHTDGTFCGYWDTEECERCLWRNDADERP